MVSYYGKDYFKKQNECVLILVVVEDGLVHNMKDLIPFKEVLILVVVDNGLVRLDCKPFICTDECLNPCCSGQWSRTVSFPDSVELSLNPCCSGQWSRTHLANVVNNIANYVLILVVVDNGLVQECCRFQTSTKSVLILVVVDNGLVLIS